MIFTNIKRLLILWIGAFVSALSLHIALWSFFYSQNIGVGSGSLEPVVMLTFAEEIIHPTIEIPLEENRLEETEEQRPEELEQKIEEQQLEESKSVVEKSDFVAQKILKKPLPPKALPTPVVKKSEANPTRSLVASNSEALNNALLAQWMANVHEQLEKQKKYVISQRTSSTKGKVQLEFRVHEQGDIFASRIAISSGDRELDRLALAALQRVGIFPPPPHFMIDKTIRIFLIFS